jgi:hypothetical protein
MYGQTARKAILRVLREAPELADLRLVTKQEGLDLRLEPWSKIRDTRSRKLADRLVSELWMMGFAVSARRPSDPAPVKGGRDPAAHKAWRDSKIKPKVDMDNSAPVRPQKSPETA